ncbi:hypothetical protein TRFO_03099 [Tritrichomonas foetus]|uniref:Uncharacterized protein n=1 Tax=Tritrichomonas foetus TaxID=1144522 RepID=A0A1J4KSL3_9EUKA|nr:hypothetical protein TRFO_03099 [Tritrichomonas foetus]|eukprot:OHT14098.1 hypothetical protein TRFO_03099 [Tritrichomonas foetus]
MSCEIHNTFDEQKHNHETSLYFFQNCDDDFDNIKWNFFNLVDDEYYKYNTNENLETSFINENSCSISHSTNSSDEFIHLFDPDFTTFCESIIRLIDNKNESENQSNQAYITEYQNKNQNKINGCFASHKQTKNNQHNSRLVNYNTIKYNLRIL